jgi:Sulfotransferase domain
MGIDLKEATKPNFLIVGAAKSGTTSLARYLSMHPEIYLSTTKEPRFLISNTIKNINKKDPSYKYLMSNSIFSLKNYLNLFKDRKEKMLGEASIHYLYHHQEAIQNIKKYLGVNTKIIILLRNPVDRAISNWKYQDKDLLGFSEALKNEDDRINKGFNSFWFYTKLGFYHMQVKSYIDNFTNVKVILFEDFIKDTSLVMNELHQFLEVDPNFIHENFKRYNESSLAITPKHDFSKVFLKTQKRINFFKRLVDNKILSNFFYFNKKNLVMKDDIEFLKELYIQDIQKLQKLINRDLSKWLKNN